MAGLGRASRPRGSRTEPSTATTEIRNLRQRAQRAQHRSIKSRMDFPFRLFIGDLRLSAPAELGWVARAGAGRPPGVLAGRKGGMRGGALPKCTDALLNFESPGPRAPPGGCCPTPPRPALPRPCAPASPARLAVRRGRRRKSRQTQTCPPCWRGSRPSPAWPAPSYIRVVYESPKTFSKLN